MAVGLSRAKHTRPEVLALAIAEDLGVADTRALGRTADPLDPLAAAGRPLAHVSPAAIAVRSASARLGRRDRDRRRSGIGVAACDRRPSTGLGSHAPPARDRGSGIRLAHLELAAGERLAALAAMHERSPGAARARAKRGSVAAAVGGRIAAAPASAHTAPLRRAPGYAPADPSLSAIARGLARARIVGRRLVPIVNPELGPCGDGLAHVLARAHVRVGAARAAACRVERRPVTIAIGDRLFEALARRAACPRAATSRRPSTLLAGCAIGGARTHAPLWRALILRHMRPFGLGLGLGLGDR